MHPDTLNGMYDWSQYDSLSYQYYVDSAGVATQSSSITVRFNLIEYSTIDGDHDYTGSQALGEYYYSFAPGITDAATGGWKTITIPFINNPGEFGAPTAFNRTGWAGIAGNERLDTCLLYTSDAATVIFLPTLPEPASNCNLREPEYPVDL